MGMTLKELLTKGEGTLSAQEAKTLAAQCRMDVETLYTLLEERGIKIIEDEADADVNLDVDSIIAEVENAENNSDELSLGGDDEEEAAEENPADLKAAMDELLDDPVKNYLKQIGQIPLLSAEQEVDLSKRIHAGAEAAHILQADRQKYSAPEYIKKNSARFSFEEDENSRSYTEDIEILKKNNKKFQFPVEWGVDIQTEHERYLTEVVFKKPVFVTDYPKEIKSFYMKQNADGKTVAAADMLVPGIGELIGGSQREEDYDKLVTRMDELGLDKSSYDWYLNLRKFGGVEHAGYGLGFERMIMYLTGIQNIRDVLPFPRTAYGF